MMYWKKSWMIPAPLLVGVELNPGPSESEIKRERIKFLKQTTKMTNLEIATAVGSSKSTVIRTGKRLKKKNPSVKTKKGQGRKRKFTKKQTAAIVKKAKEGKEAKELAREYPLKLVELLIELFNYCSEKKDFGIR